MLMTVQSELSKAQSEIISLKTSADCGPEDLNPETKCSCIDKAVKMMVEVQQEKKVAGLELAAKNMVMHKSRAELGLHPASKPTGTMADSTLYFN